jgi:hypothetical protein
MVSNDLAKQLHSRATQGESLSDEEQAQLNEWYALQDKAENEILGITEHEKTLADTQAQVDAALAQLTVVTNRIQQISSENEALRREITTTSG